MFLLLIKYVENVCCKKLLFSNINNYMTKKIRKVEICQLLKCSVVSIFIKIKISLSTTLSYFF